METNFLNIKYLKTGNVRQQKAYKVLYELEIVKKLSSYTPVLTGTIPINIDVPDSDLDIICYCKDHIEFSNVLIDCFQKEKEFMIKSGEYNGIQSTIARFKATEFDIEIFGQNIPTHLQHAYKHMVIEYKILNEMGAQFRKDIIKLKLQGIKTEPAFAKLLGLKGNPYEELLRYKI